MRHRKHSFQLGVKKEHRLALMSNLAMALLQHGRIETTLPKAKALRPFVEKIITLSKKAKAATPERALHLRRLAMARVRNKTVVHNLFEKRVDEFLDRNGGYTRIYKLGTRIGDAAEMALIELIDASDEGYKKSSRRKTPGKKKTPAKATAKAKAEEETTTPMAEAESPENEVDVAEESEPANEVETEAEDAESVQDTEEDEEDATEEEKTSDDETAKDG